MLDHAYRKYAPAIQALLLPAPRALDTMFKLAASVVWSIKATRSMLEHVKNTSIKPSVSYRWFGWKMANHDDLARTDITGLVRKLMAILAF
jgi:hypothetical protein